MITIDSPDMARVASLPVLVVIMRDEIETLPRLLRSLKGRVSGAVLVDTGSVDGTYEWCYESAMGTLRATVTLVRREWVNFGHNRNEAMNIANNLHPDSWLLLADADWEYKGSGFPFLHDKSGEWGYRVRVTGHAADLTHTCLIRGRNWGWVGPVHEYLRNTDNTVFVSDTDTFWFHHHADSGSRKHRDDVRALTEALADDPLNARARFYLGQTYYEKGQHENAIRNYELRAAMRDTWEEERWFARYMVAVCEHGLGYQSTVYSYLRAYCERPHRPEPLYGLSTYLRHHGMYDVAYRMLVNHREEQRATGTGDVLFTNRWMDEYGLECEEAVNAFYVNGPRDALTRFERIRESYRERMTPEFNHMVETNIDLCNSRIATIVNTGAHDACAID